MDRPTQNFAPTMVRKNVTKRPMKRVSQQATVSARKSDPTNNTGTRPEPTEITIIDNDDVIGTEIPSHPIRKSSATFSGVRRTAQRPVSPPFASTSRAQHIPRASADSTLSNGLRGVTPATTITQRKGRRKEETRRNPWSTHAVDIPYIKLENPRATPAPRMSVSASRHRSIAPTQANRIQKPRKTIRQPTPQVATRGASKTDNTLVTTSWSKPMARKKVKAPRISMTDSDVDLASEFDEVGPVSRARMAHSNYIDPDTDEVSDGSIEAVDDSSVSISSTESPSHSDVESVPAPALHSPPVRGPQERHQRPYVRKPQASARLVSSLCSMDFPATRPHSGLPFLSRNLRAGFLGRYQDTYPTAELEAQDEEKNTTVYVHYRISQSNDYWRGRMDHWSCPLCTIRDIFAFRKLLEAHLKWDHWDVQFEWGKPTRKGEPWHLDISFPPGIPTATPNGNWDGRERYADYCFRAAPKLQARDKHSTDGNAAQDPTATPMSPAGDLLEGIETLTVEDDEPDDEIVERQPEAPLSPRNIPIDLIPNPEEPQSEHPREQTPLPNEILQTMPMVTPTPMRSITRQPSATSKTPQIPRTAIPTTPLRDTSVQPTPHRTPGAPLPPIHETGPIPIRSGPTAKYPFLPADSLKGGPHVAYSCRPGGPRLYDLIATLPMEPFGVLEWEIRFKEEEIFELEGITDEHKVLHALWVRWIFFHRARFNRDPSEGMKQFVSENWEMIRLAAGWDAFRHWLLIFVSNRFITGKELVGIVLYYEEVCAAEP